MRDILINPLFDNELRDLSEDEFNLLREDIRESGCLDSIKLWNDTIVDGHNRFRICSELSIEFSTDQLDFEDEDEVLDWIRRNQLGKRNLTKDEFTLLLGRRYNARKKSHGGNRSSGQNVHMKTAESIASEHGVDERTVRRAAAKAAAVDAASPELQEKVRKNEVSLTVAADVASLPDSEQKEIVAKGEKEILAAAKSIREEKSAKRQVENKAIAATKMEPAVGTYSTIVIDPPWDVKKIQRDNRPNQAVELDYPTMSFDELVEFGDVVNSCASEHTHMFMWTTHKWLPPALKILEQWGWKYVLTMVWHKNGGPQPFGLPQYNCEFCIYARWGSPEFADVKAFNTCFKADRREHSRKPDEFYDLVRRVTHDGRIDIFSRERRDGFAQYGNESEKFA